MRRGWCAWGDDGSEKALTVSKVSEVDILFGADWPANGGYYPNDGIEYRSCRRCGINMAVKIGADGKAVREFCRDCAYPVHTKWYMGG